MNFDKADKIIHKVQDQWHYPILVKYGFKPETESAIGFVRKYIYTNGNHTIIASTGSNKDYWSNSKTYNSGYWFSLEPYLKSLKRVYLNK